MAYASEKTRLPAFLLCIFFGLIGAHRFYVGKIGTGILWLVMLLAALIVAYAPLMMIILDPGRMHTPDRMLTGVVAGYAIGGFLWIATLIDLIRIITGSFKDKDGRSLENWT